MELPRSMRKRPPSEPALKKKFARGWSSSSGSRPSVRDLRPPLLGSARPTISFSLALEAASSFAGDGTFLNLNSAVAEFPVLWSMVTLAEGNAASAVVRTTLKINPGSRMLCMIQGQYREQATGDREEKLLAPGC